MKLLPAADVGPGATAAKGPKGGPAIEVAAGDAADTFTLAVCADEALNEQDTMDYNGIIKNYVVRGQVKYEGAAGACILELLNEFTDRHFHTITYRDQLEIDASSDWGSFQLAPRTQSGMRLRRLTLSVILPAAGRVTVAQPLVAPGGPVTPLGESPNGWWSKRDAGVIGGVLSACMGTLGGLIGLSVAWGRSRRLTISLWSIGLAIGGVAMVTGLLALLAGQPWYVCCPPLLIGTISFWAFGGNLPRILRRFQNDEFRRMTGLDAV
ncbi:MAG TPA: hypothetical protein VHY91_23880 [Pirellulales bacterium]|jgi:hypothetical protein|nr:hypothetical protein [Pirellulales bacterium]